MATIFSKILNGEIPCYKIDETADFMAFLDVNPLKEGHTLIIPKKAVDYIFEMPNEELAQLHIYAKKIAIAIKKAIPCTKVGMAVIGLEVPHAHIHLVPMSAVVDLNFTAPRAKFTAEEYIQTLVKIQACL